MRDIVQWIRLNKAQWVLGLIAFMAVLQFANYVSYAALNVGHQSLVAARDDDASWGIAKTVKTRWWKDNGWAHYGPSYFRITHSVQYFLGHTAGFGDEQPHEQWERVAHISILLVSLISLCACMFLIASLLTSSWPHRTALTMCLVALMFADEAWSLMFLRAHPDLIFTLYCALAFTVTAAWLKNRQNRLLFAGAAVLWGVACAAKLTLVLLGPAFVLLFFPPLTKARWLEGLKFLGLMFLGYMIIGFPQSIVLDRPIRFLLTQDGLSTPADLAAVLGWLRVLGAQLWRPALTLLAVFYFLPPPTLKLSLERGDILRLSALIVFPLALIFRHHILVPADHYLLPFVAMTLLLLALVLPKRRLGTRLWTAFIPLVIMWTTVGTTPAALQTNLTSLLQCRREDRALYRKILELGKDGAKIWVDPYVPYDSSRPDTQNVSWVKSWKEADEKNYSVFVFNTNFTKRFTEGEPDLYTRKDIPEWEVDRDFYKTFVDKTEVTSPSGRVFKKTFTDSCHHEIWAM
jgi:hypothetical protein